MKYTIEDSTLTAVADKLRDKTGTVENIVPEEMPGKVDEVFAAGEKSEREWFWDTYQKNGNRNNYWYAFSGVGWTDETFRPKYDITISDGLGHGDGVFLDNKISDIVASLSRNGVVFDSSRATRLNNTFQGSVSLTMPPLDLSNCKSCSLTMYLSDVSEVQLLNVNAECTFNNMFSYCRNLSKLTVTGTIGRNGFSVEHSNKLTNDSLLSIINALADYSEDTSGAVWIVTLGGENLAKLSEEDIGTAERKGWVLA